MPERLIGPEVAERFDRWAALARRALGAELGAITIGGVEQPQLRGASGIHLAPATLAAELERCRDLAAGQAASLIEDLRARPELGDAQGLRELGIVACAAAPIAAEDRVVGTLWVGLRRARAWAPADAALLTELADAAAREVLLSVTADELERANAIVASHNRIHELIGAGEPLGDVLEAVVRSIERFDPELRGSILLLDRTLGTLYHGAAPSLPPAYVAHIDGIVIGPEVGSCGRAAATGEEVVTEDIAADPNWDGWREAAEQAGLVSCWSVPIRGADGQVLGSFGVYRGRPGTPTAAHRRFLRDAAHLTAIAIERQRDADDRTHQATHAPLTGLPNRMLLEDRLGQALARSRRSGSTLAVLMVDLDRLRLVNDSRGHDAGDDLLRQAAQRLAGCVRPGDTVAHFGADEFVVVAEEVEEVQAAAIADRILGTIAMPLVTGPAAGLTATASVGVALVSGKEVDVREAIRRADDAMTLAKSEGGNRHRRCDGGRLVAAGRRLELETALRGALERGEFHLVAQPVVPFGAAQATGFEALVRWTHPELGVVGPDEFVPITEVTGIIDELGAWVLREATWAAGALQKATRSLVEIAVNVSPRQLRDPGFSDLVVAALQRAGLQSEQLVVEITETALMGSDRTTVETISALKRLGVRLALDDFGTGFSSLSMLKDHPIDIIKIDRSFVAGLPADGSSAAIVAAVVGMAHALGRTVTAEGIETPEQLAFLQALGCDHAQGYLHGRPEPFDGLRARLAG